MSQLLTVLRLVWNLLSIGSTTSGDQLAVVGVRSYFGIVMFFIILF
jgi:hypothetical protein